MADYYIDPGDAPIQAETFKDETGAAVLIQGATVTMTATPIRGATPIVNAGTVTNLDDGSPANRGKVSYQWTTAQTNAAAGQDLLQKFEATFAGPAPLSFPDPGYLIIHVEAVAPTTTPRYCTREELKRAFSMQGTSFADGDIDDAIAAAAGVIEKYCDRVFTTDTSPSTRTYTPISTSYLLIDDLISSAPTVTSSGATLVQNTDYYLKPVRITKIGPPYDVLNWSSSGIVSTTLQNTVTVNGLWGWPLVPPEIKQAAKILAGQYLKRTREAVFGIVSYGDSEAMRISRYDAQLAGLLDPYRRSSMVE